MLRIGGGFVGSASSQTSTAGQELVNPSLFPSNVAKEFYKFKFYNAQACTVQVNGNTIYLDANQNFESNQYDAPVTSFIIQTAEVTFTWVGYYPNY